MENNITVIFCQDLKKRTAALRSVLLFKFHSDLSSYENLQAGKSTMDIISATIGSP